LTPAPTEDNRVFLRAASSASASLCALRLYEGLLEPSKESACKERILVRYLVEAAGGSLPPKEMRPDVTRNNA